MIVVIHDEMPEQPTLVVDADQARSLFEEGGPALERGLEAVAARDAALYIRPEFIGRVMAPIYKSVTAVHNTVQLDGDTEGRLQRALAQVGLDLHSSVY